jgi:chemotaxis protein histidine kinase CheA
VTQSDNGTSDNKGTSAEFFQPSKSLKEKVDSNGSVEGSFAAANKAVEDLAIVFIERLPEDLNDIADALNALECNGNDAALKRKLFKLVHDLKGQAGTFDYMLVTVIGNDLCRFIEHSEEITPIQIKVMRFHLDAMQRVVDLKMTGDDNEQGQRMITTLQGMTQKVLQG